MSVDGPLGVFEEQVMLAVVHAAGDAFGMSVRHEIESRTGREVAIGAVYATLDRLEAKRLVASVRSNTSGASRRVFRITAAGARVVEETRVMRDRLWHGIDLRRLAAVARG